MENSNTAGHGSNGIAGKSSGMGDDARQQAMRRAEELADRWAVQLGQFASSVGHGILKWAARAREEAEDIWAEAQAIRQGQPLVTDQPQPAPAERTESIWAEAQAIRQHRQSATDASKGLPPRRG